MAGEQTVKMFWEGPGASRNGQGLTLAVTVLPDGNGEITNHQARTQLRVGDVQLVVQVSCCDIMPAQFTADQREAIDVVLTAMVERMRDELGITGECEDEEAEGNESEDDADVGMYVSDYSDADLAAMEQGKLVELLGSVEDLDSEGAERVLQHITDQGLLCEFWADNDVAEFDATVAKRLAACIVADGAVTTLHFSECPEDIAFVAAACEGDALAAFARVLTEEQRWTVIDSNDLNSHQEYCILECCTDQEELDKVLRGDEHVFLDTGRRIALSRMTDVGILRRTLDELYDDDPLLLDVRERYLTLNEKAQKKR